ncbi:uncharacterized protein F4807DRAFT_404303, partial [Annulohypoxylon truncatum]|uniref:uncharacterized protein n=1 Tax=Annulohypoxylon truncatum TaxID=327061 RepID=UPI002008E384
MPEDDPQPLSAHEISPLLTEIAGLEATLPAFEPRGPTTPARYFQTSIQKNLEWSRHALARLAASLRKYDKDVYNSSRIAHYMTMLRGVIAKLESYDRRIDEMRRAQGEHVGVSDIFRTTAGGGGGAKKMESYPYASAARLLDGPQRFTYYDPP